MYIYLIVVWNTIIHFEKDSSTTKNQRIVTRDQPFPSAAASICIYLYNPRHPVTDKHSNTSTTLKLHMVMSYLVKVGGGTHHFTSHRTTMVENNLYFNCEEYCKMFELCKQ